MANIHKEEGIDAKEASSTDVQYTVGVFFSSLYNLNFLILLKSMNFSQHNVCLTTSMWIVVDTFPVILLQILIIWSNVAWKQIRVFNTELSTSFLIS